MLANSPAGAMIRNIISEIAHEPELVSLIVSLEKERRTVIYQLLRPLDQAMDRDLMVSLLFGPLYFRCGERLDQDFVKNCVNAALRAAQHTFGAHGAG